jgi:hypothetical protein
MGEPEKLHQGSAFILEFLRYRFTCEDLDFRGEVNCTSFVLPEILDDIAPTLILLEADTVEVPGMLFQIRAVGLVVSFFLRAEIIVELAFEPFESPLSGFPGFLLARPGRA